MKNPAVCYACGPKLLKDVNGIREIDACIGTYMTGNP
jgi:hypothetical protein